MERFAGFSGTLMVTLSNANDIDRLQQDSRSLWICFQDWQMLLNMNKCWIMHMEYINSKSNYDKLAKAQLKKSWVDRTFFHTLKLVSDVWCNTALLILMKFE